MELRDLEVFLTLAEDLQCGRTAERLYVSQARVSQAIKSQEAQIGGALFERSSRRVILTPLGERLRDDLADGYGAIIAGVAKARESARGAVGTLRLGVMGSDSGMFIDLLDEFRRRNPGAELETREITFSDAFGPLRRGEVDAAVVWKPVWDPDLTVGPTVFTCGRVFAVWKGHPLADRESISLEDLADHLIGDPVGGPEHWMDGMIPRHTPSGRPIPRSGPRPSTFSELLALVAGRRSAMVAGSPATFYGGHPGVVFVPIADAPPLEYALVWRTANAGPLVGAFADACRAPWPEGAPDA
ncbi:MAG TPA: LysR family transcriptional regulator [Agromyces sp.]